MTALVLLILKHSLAMGVEGAEVSGLATLEPVVHVSPRCIGIKGPAPQVQGLFGWRRRPPTNSLLSRSL